MSTGSPALLYAVSGVTFSAGGRVIIPDISFELNQGRIYGLVGANGSGKSTLIRMLARQCQPRSGRISLLGKNILDYASRAFARTVGYMPQFTPPAEGMTVSELVALGRFPWHGALGRFGTDDQVKVDEALLQTGLTDFSNRLVDSLSGGERQRVWLAMMIAQDTRCLLLDEPTSALDIAHQMDMLSLIRDLSRARGLAVVIVLHDINMAARICDEIIALSAGRIVARGTPEAIMDSEVLGGIYGLPMGVLPHPVKGMPISYVI
ncbi:MAG: ATP-binding cassette domain-containing protein [Phyllobacterium sp.]